MKNKKATSFFKMNSTVTTLASPPSLPLLLLHKLLLLQSHQVANANTAIHGNRCQRVVAGATEHQ